MKKLLTIWKLIDSVIQVVLMVAIVNFYFIVHNPDNSIFLYAFCLFLGGWQLFSAFFSIAGKRRSKYRIYYEISLLMLGVVVFLGYNQLLGFGKGIYGLLFLLPPVQAIFYLGITIAELKELVK